MAAKHGCLLGKTGNGGVRFMRSSWAINRYTGITAVGGCLWSCRDDVKVNVSTTTTTILCGRHDNMHSKFAASALMRQSCFHQLKYVYQTEQKKTPQMSIHTYLNFCSFQKLLFSLWLFKTFMETHFVSVMSCSLQVAMATWSSHLCICNQRSVALAFSFINYSRSIRLTE